jgi:hypothetical protein
MQSTSTGNGMKISHKIAAAFAVGVTASASTRQFWIARNGDESLYRLFRRILPEVEFT